jgi:hypothetical protein
MLRAASTYSWFDLSVQSVGERHDLSFPGYVQSSYMEIPYTDGVTAYPYEWAPFEANYDLRNCVYGFADVDSSTGFLTTGFDDFYWPFRLCVPATYEFTDYGNYGTIPSVLGAAQTQWLHPGWWYSEVGLSLNGDDIDMAVNARNYYGLPLLSVKVAWVGLNPLQVLTVSAGGYITLPGVEESLDWLYFYPEAALPQLENAGWYFARPNVDWLPGHDSFSVTNPSPLLITSVGEPINVAGYAKLAIANGYAGKYAYLGQYFDKAYKANPDGTRSTNETGFLSPYGEFFPTEPGRAILTTLPDGVSTNVGECTVHVISINVDANHDGEMDCTLTGPDQTSVSRPFGFWVNNDFDRAHLVDCVPGPCDNEEDDVSDNDPSADCPATPLKSTPDADYQDLPGLYVIPCSRDLEDYTRLWIPGIAELYQTHSNLTFQLSVVSDGLTGDPAINLFQAVETNGGTLYLTDTNVAATQVFSSVSFYTRVQPNAPVLLNNIFLLSGQPSDYFILCGAKRGSGQVVLTVLDGATVLAETSLSVQFKDIKEMYERWTAGDNGALAPWTEARAAVEDLPASVGDSGFQHSYNPTSDSDTPYILHVHGWNMERWDKDRFAETAFKRLYWQGYQGRFGSFRWPTLAKFPAISGEGADLNHFDKSEFNAWQSGAALRKLLVSLESKLPGQLRLSAHSMGNIVAGEALNTNTPLVAVYIAMQAAVPSGAYWLGAPIRAIPTLYFDDTTELYRFYPVFVPSSPYLNFSAGAADYVNFYNQSDWALNLWLTDQNLKPADSLDYSFDISSNTFFQFQGTPTQRILTTPTNTFELFAFCVEGQCWALGAQTNVAGVFTTARQLDLDATFAFGNAHKGHSGQFRLTNMKRAAFWTTYATRLGVK